MKKQARSSLQNLSITYELTLAIGNSLNLSEMLQEVIYKIVHKTNAHRGIIWVKDGEKKLQPVASAGISIEDVLAQSEIEDHRNLLNQIDKRGQFVLRYKDDKEFFQYCPLLTEKEESVLIVPVTNVAILYLVYASRGIADEPLANIFAGLSKKLSVAIEACSAYKAIANEVQVRVEAEEELKKKTEQLISGEKELQRLYGESEQARKSLLSILEDVSQKEKALKASEKELINANDIINRSPAVAFIWKNQKELPVEYATSNVINLFGYSVEEFRMGKAVYTDFIHPDDFDRVNNEVSLAGKDKDNNSFVHKPYRIITRSKETRWVEDRTTIIRDTKGAITHYQGIVIDITDKILIETDKQQALEKILHYQELFEESLNEIYIFDADSYKFVDVNRSALNNLGYTADEIADLTPIDIKPEFSKLDFDKLMQDFRSKDQDKIVFNTIHKRKNGTTYPVEVNLRRTKHENRQVFVAIILDITDRLKVEKGLRRSREHLEETVSQRTAEIKNQSKKLEESQAALTYLLEDMNDAQTKMEETNIQLIAVNKELESFSYSVSHDLRAPLRAIIGFSAKFNNQYNALIDEEGKRLLTVISRSALKMGRLIDDLLTFSRMSRTEIRKLDVHMKNLADEAWVEIIEQAAGRDIQIDIQTLPDAKGDRNMLKQVYINLLSNAIKFSKPKVQNVIEVGADLTDGEYIYYVKDKGVGFDMKYAEKLFQVFQRLHSEKEFEGTGVGLALVQRIINKHEGKIWAESVVEKGAKFSFTLPA